MPVTETDVMGLNPKLAVLVSAVFMVSLSNHRGRPRQVRMLNFYDP